MALQNKRPRTVSLLAPVTVLIASTLACASGVVRHQGELQRERWLSISGTVTDQDSGRPVRGALIVIESKPQRRTGTDSGGHYRVDSLPYKDYFVQVRAVGAILERREVRVGCSVAIFDETGTRILTPRRCVSPDQILNFSLRADIPW
jgi:hypothetical protein